MQVQGPLPCGWHGSYLLVARCIALLYACCSSSNRTLSSSRSPLGNSREACGWACTARGTSRLTHCPPSAALCLASAWQQKNVGSICESFCQVKCNV